MARLSARVTVVKDDELDKGFPNLYDTVVEVTTKAGKTYSEKNGRDFLTFSGTGAPVYPRLCGARLARWHVANANRPSMYRALNGNLPLDQLRARVHAAHDAVLAEAATRARKPGRNTRLPAVFLAYLKTPQPAVRRRAPRDAPPAPPGVPDDVLDLPTNARAWMTAQVAVAADFLAGLRAGLE